MNDLYPYQVEGARFLASRDTALLADDPGLGKSAQAIRACDLVRALTVCVICPAGLVENWKREIARFREGDWSAFVTSFEKAAGSDRLKILPRHWDVMVIDEAHYLKNPRAKRTVSIYGAKLARGRDALAHCAARVWVLTGTPMPNDAGELYSHLRALRPQALPVGHKGDPWTFEQFQHRFCTMKPTGFGMKITGSKNEDDLRARLDGFMLRRRKADVLKELPPLTFGEVALAASFDGLDAEVEQELRTALETDGIDSLRRFVTNGSMSTLRRLTGLAKAAPAAQWVEDWLESTPKERKIVVFAHHTSVIEELYGKLHIRAVRVHGSMKQDERQKSVDRLQNDPMVRVFIGQLTAAGVGITLTKASDLLFVESSWVPAENEQAAMRIHRIGQTEPCLVRFAVVPGSIDEAIQRAVSRKMQSIAKVVDGVAA